MSINYAYSPTATTGGDLVTIRSQISTQDATIAELRSDLAVRDISIGNLRTMLRDSDTEIQRLRVEVSRLTQIAQDLQMGRNAGLTPRGSGIDSDVAHHYADKVMRP